MTARILIVDDIPANVKYLEMRLQAEYFDTLTASSGAEALEIANKGCVDVVLLDVMMPGMDGFETCRRLKENPKTWHVPVIMVTALDQPSDRIRGLESGADDFLTKPVDDIALLARVKNLTRLKILTDEMILRTETTERLGLEKTTNSKFLQDMENGRVLIIGNNGTADKRLKEILSKEQEVDICANPEFMTQALHDIDYDLVLINLDLDNFDGLRLCSQIRSDQKNRHVPIMLIVNPDEQARLLRGLEMGVNDYVTRPLDRMELGLRIRNQVKHKRFYDSLQDKLEERVEMAIIDPLTGLHNRRYLDNHLASLISDSLKRNRTISLMVIDIDFFKLVNDNHGHDIGDEVLVEFAARLRKNTRGLDLACRVGGEEFVIVLPKTDRVKAFRVAERLRQSIGKKPFDISGNGGSLNLTASIGIGTLERVDDTVSLIMKRADVAVYAAKQAGRNKVIAQAA